MKEGTARWGEDIAAGVLIADGCNVLYRNWRMGHYEVDIIAQKDNFIVFAEVKTRTSDFEDPVRAIDMRKRQRIIRSADVFIRTYNLPFDFRFDIITIIGTKENYKVEHIPDAYFPR